MKQRHVILTVSGLLAVGAAAGAGLGTGLGLRSPSAPGAASNAYSELVACNGCPSDTQLTSVEVQARQGSTLFILGGRWPAAVDGFKVDVCLNANDIQLQLKPHGTRNLFEPTITTATETNPTTQLAQAVATGLQNGALLIDLRAPAQLTAPVAFDVALCNTDATLQRLPHAGELLWNGHGAPRQFTPSTTPSSSAAAQPAPGGLDTCTALPSGTVPPYLQMTGWSGGVKTDPRTLAPTESVSVSLSSSPAGATAPFAIVVTVFPANVPPPPASTSLIDVMGTVQLYAYSDGLSLHKALRTYQHGAWTLLTDAGAGAMTIALGNGLATFYWTGFRIGDRYAFVSAAQTGCSSLALSPSLTPLGVINS